jgi:signal transduction histidine kinase
MRGSFERGRGVLGGIPTAAYRSGAVLQDRARETELERSILRVRLVAIALGSTILALAPERAPWVAAGILVAYALAAGLVRFAVPRVAARWVPAASIAVDIAYATAFVIVLPLAEATWALYAFGIGAAALRYGPHGALVTTAFAIVGYAIALAVRLGEVRTGELWSLQIVIGLGLLCAELTWAVVRSAEERRETRDFIRAQRDLVSVRDTGELLDRLADHAVATLGASGAWIRDGLAPGGVLGASRGRAPATESEVIEGAIELPLDPPRTSLFLVFDGSPPERALALARDLAGQAAVLLVAARERHDITRSRDQLRALADHLTAEVRKRDDTLASVAHELRSPLTSVKGYGQLMSRNLQAALEALTQLDRLIGDLQQLPAGPPTLDLTHVDLVQAAREAARRIELGAGAAPAVVVEGDGPFVVRADNGRIAQVLDNVLENAAKYSPKGAPIEIRLRRDDGEVIVAVSDRGKGLAAADLGRIFERYERARADGETVPGQGIGLSVARELVEAHGGRIWATSDGPGRGSTFWIALPTAVGSPQEEDVTSRS